MTTDFNDRTQGYYLSSGPLPTFKRRRRRALSDKGLPPDEELSNLATAYLDQQRKLWPEMVASGTLPAPTAQVIGEMVEDFKARHRTGIAATAIPLALLQLRSKLAGCYARFSCDNSKTVSNIDQMVNALRSAKARNEFIPWQYVFCDYSVSGLDNDRQGFTSYKSVLADASHKISTTYIDDFSRASRQEFEWCKLAYSSKRLGKNVIGASDGFDLQSSTSEESMTLHSLMSKLFIKSLRQKVNRGMKGGHRRRTSLGKMPFGYTRQPQLDANGRVVCNSDGTPVFVRCIDPINSDHARRIFELFWVQKRSVSQITKLFNSERVDDWDGWTDGGIKKILSSPAYIGVFIWNKFRSEFDLEAGKWIRVKNPRSEWECFYEPALAIIPMDWYRGTRRRLTEARHRSPNTGKKRSRNQVSATTLFSGTLFCKDCGNEIKLIRSTKKYKQMGCINGCAGRHKCSLRSSKSTRTIEACLLQFLLETVLSDTIVDRLIDAANACIDQESLRPRTDVTAKQAKLRTLKRKVERLVAELEDEDRDFVRKVLCTRISELEGDINELAGELATISRDEAPSPAKLDREQIRKYLCEIREVLNESTAASADAIRSITGPITIHQEVVPGRKRGAKWIATFSPRFLQFLAKFAKDGNYPDSRTLEYLSARIWTMPETVNVEIQEVRKADEIAVEVTGLVAAGYSDDTIASMLRVSPQVVQETRTGQKRVRGHQIKKSKREPGGPGGGQRPTFHDLVLPLKKLIAEEPGISHSEIARRLNCCEATVRRAFDTAFPEVVASALANATPPQRGSRSRLSKQEIERVKELLKLKVPLCEIEAETGCGRSAVQRIKSNL